jgi:hypothetical protein
MCTASVPSTNENGDYIDIGKNPHKILFGYLNGFGASRHTINSYLTLNDVGMLTDSTIQPVNDHDKPVVICKKK